jgi:hypothetical protein
MELSLDREMDVYRVGCEIFFTDSWSRRAPAMDTSDAL